MFDDQYTNSDYHEYVWDDETKTFVKKQPPKQQADDKAEDYGPPKRSSCSWPGLLNRPHRVMLVDDLLFKAGVITMVADSGGGKTSTPLARCPDHEVRSLGGSGCPQAQ